MQLFSHERMWRRHSLKDHYDVVIIGGGVHGLASAYYLAKSGVTDVAVIEQGYVGSGASGRNTAIIRANYRTAEGIPFYQESLKLYEGLSRELGFNVLFSQQGHLTLGHTDSAMKGLRERASTNQLLGIESRIIDRQQVGRLVPDLDISDRPRYPIQGALYHPPGGIIRHDAVVWGFGRSADRRGVQIHPHTRVTGIRVTNSQVEAVETDRGTIRTGTVVNATAGWCSTIARMVGVDLPITTHPLQACVTERLKPFLDKVVVSSNLHVYVSQTDRGEVVLGEEINPYTSYSNRSTLRFLENVAAHTLELFPCLHNVKILRQWAGICDMSPDYSPIMGFVPRVRGFVLDVGWGTYGFKAGPVSGKRIAELIVTGKTPDLIRPFSITRFHEGRLVGEKAAAAVSH
jgi:sarcosine oxidase, subunit beta